MFHKNPIVLTTGCFVVLHSDHIRLFEYASKFGEVVVGINTDAYLIKKHGYVPIPLVDRIYHLSSIKYINKVVAFNEDNASELIKRIKPNIFIKGSDYRNQNIPEIDACNEVNSKFIICPNKRIYSSSNLLKELPNPLVEDQ